MADCTNEETNALLGLWGASDVQEQLHVYSLKEEKYTFCVFLRTNVKHKK